jgi:hypothetical protein
VLGLIGVPFNGFPRMNAIIVAGRVKRHDRLTDDIENAQEPCGECKRLSI